MYNIASRLYTFLKVITPNSDEIIIPEFVQKEYNIPLTGFNEEKINIS